MTGAGRPGMVLAPDSSIPMPTDASRPRGPRRPEEDAVFRARRRERRLLQELGVRATVALLIFGYNEALAFGDGAGPDRVVRVLTVCAFLVNVPYWVAAHFGRGWRAQAYGRMLVDIGLITGGLYAAGGLAAAPYVAVYVLVPVYVGTVLSSVASLVATAAATVAYVAIVALQRAGLLPAPDVPAPNAWAVAAFNLLVLNVVGAMTALLSEAYRQSRRRLIVLYEELERAYDESSRLNAEIQRSARLHVLGEVVAGVTHEIGNALQGAILPLDLLRETVGPAPDVTRHLDRVEYACGTALRIVRNVLQSARHGAGEQVLVSLAEVARRTVELKGYDLRRAGIVVQLDFPRDFPPVRGNPFRLQQVLLNLVSNAQDALRESGARAIAIAGSVDADRAVVEVRDTGPGIPADVLPRLFEPFYTTKASGTGLGLAICADIVRELGGQLTARNAPGGGAIFRMTLPLARTRPAAGVPAASA